ncbi:hypothetical protein G7Y79_00066g094860 [Physcia stellaris]|nr:hypothetical protein G7Y79_00066g094860 [Physcia stellaris]
MSTSDPDHDLIQISIPSCILPFRIPLSPYLGSSQRYTNLAVAACIFTTRAPKRLLLVQRAASERGWEVPGGSVDTSDPTILHGLAREVFEETGLKLTKFVRTVGQGIEFNTGPEKRWIKLSFEIEIQGGASKNTKITLDPTEHQAFKWATKEEVDGWGTDNIVTPQQRDMMLLAFEQRDQTEAKQTRAYTSP